MGGTERTEAPHALFKKRTKEKKQITKKQNRQRLKCYSLERGERATTLDKRGKEGGLVGVFETGSKGGDASPTLAINWGAPRGGLRSRGIGTVGPGKKKNDGKSKTSKRVGERSKKMAGTLGTNSPKSNKEIKPGAT